MRRAKSKSEHIFARSEWDAGEKTWQNAELLLIRNGVSGTKDSVLSMC